MVARRLILLLLLIAWATAACGQKIDHTDTVTEHLHQGTYYHNRFEGRRTASGEIFRQNRFTAAHKSIKMGTYLLVTNCSTGKQVIVKVNDRCPRPGVLDLSRRAATSIGIKGKEAVTFRILPEGYEKRCLAQSQVFDSVDAHHSKAPHHKAQDKALASKSKAEKPAKPTKAEQRLSATATFDMLVGFAATHGEAYDIIQELPAKYRDMILVAPLDDDSGFNIIIDLNMKKDAILKLQKSLKGEYPGCIIVPSED